ncbi:hypothetical protein [Shimia isoporae]|nr:hypothetical protein [Shimia isoporae]
MQAPSMRQWWVCENTWFVGVDALPNDETGSINNVPFGGAPVTAIKALYGSWPDLHKAQLSVVSPGYPRPREDESEAAFGYRLRRDAAHVDGLKRGPNGERFLEEPHAWIMGLPLTANEPDQGPLVVWDGSHEIMRNAFAAALGDVPPEKWSVTDIRQPYQQARRAVFEQCQRICVQAKPGETILVHRLLLHGVGPWADTYESAQEHRAIAYFRPELNSVGNDWLKLR